MGFNEFIVIEVLKMKNNIKVISGTFEKGCGIMVWDKVTDKIYHKIVFEDKNGCCIEVENIRYYKKDLQF